MAIPSNVGGKNCNILPNKVYTIMTSSFCQCTAGCSWHFKTITLFNDFLTELCYNTIIVPCLNDFYCLLYLLTSSFCHSIQLYIHDCYIRVTAVLSISSHHNGQTLDNIQSIILGVMPMSFQSVAGVNKILGNVNRTGTERNCQQKMPDEGHCVRLYLMLLFYSLYIMLSPVNSLDKALGLSYIFVCVSIAL